MAVGELDVFKREINLSEYAATQGYRIDREAGDKIVLARGQDEHWIYFSVRDERDNGSIVDFVQKRKGVKLGGVRQELRPWTGGGWGDPARPHPNLFAQEIAPVSKDRAQILRELARMQPLVFYAWLEEERAIPRSRLLDPRFAGRIRVDFQANAVFPHASRDGPCGYEIKNQGFTGFARGGDKGLWLSAARAGDTAMVIAESGIDAFSYAALHAARIPQTGEAWLAQRAFQRIAWLGPYVGPRLRCAQMAAGHMRADTDASTPCSRAGLAALAGGARDDAEPLGPAAFAVL
jgi:hypothetical protein